MTRAVPLLLVSVFALLLTGCPCGGPAGEVSLTPLSGPFGYGLTGPYGFQGSLTKAYPGDAEWTLSGTFRFPSSGYGVLGPAVEALESFPEQVNVTLRVLLPRPGTGGLTVITEVPVSYRIPASDQATFDIRVEERCFPGPVTECETPAPIDVSPMEEGEGHVVSGERFDGVLEQGPAGEFPSVPWTLDGVFTFPTTGYVLRTPVVNIAESYPEQVTIRLGYIAPSGDVGPAITEIPLSVDIGTVHKDATFYVEVEVCREGSG